MSPDFRRMLDIHRGHGGENRPVREFDTAELTAEGLRDDRPQASRTEYSVKGFADHAVFSPNGQQVMITTSSPRWSNGTVQVWDRKSGCPAYPAFTHPEGIRFAAYSPSGHRVVTVTRSRWQAWDAATGQPVGPEGRWTSSGRLRFAGVRPDDNAVLLLDEEFAAQLWAIDSGQAIGTKFQLPWAGFATFSPDGSRVVAAAGGNAGQIVDALTGQKVGPTIPGLFSAGAGDIMFSPDGTRVLSLDRKGIRVFEVATGQPITPLLPVRGLEIAGVGFSPDGRQFGVVEARIAPDDRFELVGREWVLAPDQTPAEMTLAARVASGLEADAVGGLVLVTADRQQADWVRYRAGNPPSVWSSDQIRDWHLGRAMEAELRGTPDWPAAAFHLGVLVAVDPGDVSLRDRLNRAVRERDALPRSPAPPPRPLRP